MKWQYEAYCMFDELKCWVKVFSAIDNNLQKVDILSIKEKILIYSQIKISIKKSW